MTIPVYDAMGVFTLKAPFTADVNKTYVCESIQGFEALDAAGVKIFDVYYAPKNIAVEIYNTDRKNNECIVTLLSENGPTIHVPSSFILGSPRARRIPYANLVLTFDLGLLPDAMDLTPTMVQVTELLESNVGIAPTANLSKVSLANAVDEAKHKTLEAARIANVNTEDTYKKQLAAANKIIADKTTRISELEAAIIKLQE